MQKLDHNEHAVEEGIMASNVRHFVHEDQAQLVCGEVAQQGLGN